MNWVKVYNSLPTHPKILQAGDRAAWLYVCGLCYANEHLTDGHLSRSVLGSFSPGSPRPRALAARLVEAGLWEETEDGWQIHNYTDVQRSSAQVKAFRRKDSQRKASNSTVDSTVDSTPDSNGDSTPDSTVDSRWPRALAREEKIREEKKTPPSPPKGGNRARDRDAFINDLVAWAASVGVTEPGTRMEPPGTNLLKAYRTAKVDEVPDPAAAFRAAATRYYHDWLVIQ